MARCDTCRGDGVHATRCPERTPAPPPRPTREDQPMADQKREIRRPVTATDRKAFDRLTSNGVPLGRDYKAVLDEGRRLRDAEYKP